MSIWNHRLVSEMNEDVRHVSMCEVYYDDDGKPWGHCSAAVDWVSDWDGDPVNTIKRTLERMMLACEQPILIYPDDFDGEELGR